MAKRRREGRGAGAPGQRQLRVGEALRHALAAVLARGELRDPALRDRAITVSEVRVSPDLRHATAFVSRLGGGDMAAVLEGLERAAPRLNALTANAVRLRRAPRLRFAADSSFDRAARIASLLTAGPRRAANDPGAPASADPRAPGGE